MTGRTTGLCNTNATDEMGGRGRQQGFDPKSALASLEKRLAALEGK
jgi:hypothetical protein